MKLDTQNIFLDTSTFEQNNFLVGKKLNSLLEHTDDNSINVFSSEIAIKELKERVRKKILKAKSEIKKFRNTKPKSVEIFRNTETYEIFDQVWRIKFDEEIEKINLKIDDLIKNTPIQLIETNGIDIDEVFNKYFKNKAPFKEGDKKYEFPDAFILASIEKWCIENNSKMIIISNDKDWLNYESEFIIKIKELDELLIKIAIQKEISLKEQKLEFIQQIYDTSFENLEKELNDYIENNSYLDTGEADLIKYEISEFDWGEYDITAIGEEYAMLKANVNIKIKVWVSYQDYSTGYYDKENNDWHFVETIKGTFEKEIEVPITLEVSFEFESKDYEINIETVNNDEEIELEYNIHRNEIYE
jgi:hypothetical protein